MDVMRIVAELDNEIEKLQQARAAIVALDGVGHYSPVRSNVPVKTTAKATKRGKGNKHHRWSTEARERMSQRMKQRWAARKGKQTRARAATA